MCRLPESRNVIYRWNYLDILSNLNYKHLQYVLQVQEKIKSVKSNNLKPSIDASTDYNNSTPFSNTHKQYLHDDWS